MSGPQRLPGQVARFADFRDWSSVVGQKIDVAFSRLTKTVMGIPAGFLGTTPLTVQVGGSASPGTKLDGWMAAGAQLVVAAGTALGLANANANGSSTAAARGDHQHKRDVRVFAEGVEIGTRNALNFIGSPSVTDDPGNDRTVVEVGGDVVVDPFASVVSSHGN